MHYFEVNFFLNSLKTTHGRLVFFIMWPRSLSQKAYFTYTLFNFHSLLPVLFPILSAGWPSISFHCVLRWYELAAAEGTSPTLLMLLKKFFLPITLNESWIFPTTHPAFLKNLSQWQVFSFLPPHFLLAKSKRKAQVNTCLVSTSCSQIIAICSNSEATLTNVNRLPLILRLPCEILLQKVEEPCECSSTTASKSRTGILGTRGSRLLGPSCCYRTLVPSCSDQMV